MPESHEIRHLPELKAGQDVLALYPGTTCFYKATVILPPKQVRCWVARQRVLRLAHVTFYLEQGY